MKLYSEAQICEILNISRTYLYFCRKSGLPYIRLGTRSIRYNLEEVMEWFEKQSKGGVA